MLSRRYAVYTHMLYYVSDQYITEAVYTYIYYLSNDYGCGLETIATYLACAALLINFYYYLGNDY